MTRQYETTHPWITFKPHLDKISHKTWIQLGEAQAKCEALAGAPLKPEVSHQLHLLYVSKGAHGTSAIEGNTLSEEEVRRRVTDDLKLPESKEYLGHEIDNILRAFNETASEVAEQSNPLCVDDLKSLNKLMLDGQPVDPDVRPGEIREHSVGVLRYRGAPAEDCEYLLERTCAWLRDGFHVEAEQSYMTFAVAVVKALLAHLYIAWIHPFGDGNGRVARMAEFRFLVAAGLPWPACHLLSNHYNQTREAYYHALDLTSKADGYPVETFIAYAVQGLRDGLDEQAGMIRESQMKVTWENYVHEKFRDQHTPARSRQKQIALALSADAPTQVAKIRYLNPLIAESYAGKTSKTVTRDLHELEARGLVRRRRDGIVANTQVVRAFLPRSIDPN